MRKQCYSGVGGQAVLEGVMMKNQDQCAVAVRKSDGTIDVHVTEFKDSLSKSRLKEIPFLRGVLNFIDSMRLGISSLNVSAEAGMDDVEEQPGKFELWLERRFGEKAGDIILTITMIVSVILAVGIFMVLPYALSALLGVFVHNKLILSISEAVMRFAIFIGYVTLIGQMSDIRRLYQYHGAEHKCINCIEKGRELTVSNVKRCSRLHPRCGTSFMLYVMMISCVLFFFITVDNIVLRLVIRLLLIPIIAGISYELIRLAGRYDNVFTRWMSKPGMALQKITTKEPDEEMIEVAIQSVEAVFDWKAFLMDHFRYDVDAWNDAEHAARAEEDADEDYGEAVYEDGGAEAYAVEPDAYYGSDRAQDGEGYYEADGAYVKDADEDMEGAYAKDADVDTEDAYAGEEWETLGD